MFVIQGLGLLSKYATIYMHVSKIGGVLSKGVDWWSEYWFRTLPLFQM